MCCLLVWFGLCREDTERQQARAGWWMEKLEPFDFGRIEHSPCEAFFLRPDSLGFEEGGKSMQYIVLVDLLTQLVYLLNLTLAINTFPNRVANDASLFFALFNQYDTVGEPPEPGMRNDGSPPSSSQALPVPAHMMVSSSSS